MSSVKKEKPVLEGSYEDVGWESGILTYVGNREAYEIIAEEGWGTDKVEFKDPWTDPDRVKGCSSAEVVYESDELWNLKKSVVFRWCPEYKCKIREGDELVDIEKRGFKLEEKFYERHFPKHVVHGFTEEGHDNLFMATICSFYSGIDSLGVYVALLASYFKLVSPAISIPFAITSLIFSGLSAYGAVHYGIEASKQRDPHNIWFEVGKETLKYRAGYDIVKVESSKET
jgi:hypothetical protein